QAAGRLRERRGRAVMTTEHEGNANGRDIVYASYHGVAVWRSPDKPLVKIAAANRGDVLAVVARLKDAWLQVQLADGTAGVVQLGAGNSTEHLAAASGAPPL